MSAVTGPQRRVGLRLVAVIVFLLAILWQVYGAVSNLLAWYFFAARLGRDLTGFAWIVLVLGLLIPLAAAPVGLVFGRRRTAGTFALVLLLALCVSEALSLSQLAFFLSVIGAL